LAKASGAQRENYEISPLGIHWPDIDEVIMPHSTRRRVARALAMLREKAVEQPWKKHDNIPL
ncbi:MAG: methylmalonyl-CoA carboxyltransferase, partial [Microvirga sp.]